MIDWQAKWIWVNGHSETPNCYIYARRAFDLESVPDAELHVTCSSEYRLYINGRYAGGGQRQCGDTHQFFNRHDVKRYLRPGPNVIGAICRNCASGIPGGFLAQLNASHAPEPLLITDDQWRVMLATDWDCSVAGNCEAYNSNLKPVGWNVVGFDDSGWQEPCLLGDADKCGELVYRSIPSLEETEICPTAVHDFTTDSIHAPKNLLESRGGLVTVNPLGEPSIVLDFGREITGTPEIRVRDGCAARADIAYSELPSFPNALDNPMQSDSVVFHGGRQVWRAFGRRTFRYMRLTFSNLDCPVILSGVSVRSIGYPARQAWSFECSDDMLNDIYQMGAHTLSLCMQDCYERDPLRHPASHPTDARIQALINQHTFADVDLAASDLRSFARSIRDDRMPSPSQALSWVMMLHDHYLHTGHQSLVEELYPCLVKIMDEYLPSREGTSGLLADSTGAELALWNAPYYQALRDASKLAVAVENLDDTQSWHRRSETIRAAFNERFWNADLCAYTASPMANVLAAAFGLADTNRADALRPIISANAHKLGPSLSFYTLAAMAKLDMIDEALELIRKGWGGMLERGATTCWSRFPDPGDESKLPSSFCRGRCASPSAFLPSEVLGIKPALPDASGAIVQPNPGDLTWARGGYELPGSRLSVEWQIIDGAFVLDIDAPDGVIAAIPVSGFQNPVIHEIDLTPETPERRARKTYGWGDVIWRAGEERDPYLDWLETQEAEPPDHYQPKSRCNLQGRHIWVRETISRHVRYRVHEG